MIKWYGTGRLTVDPELEQSKTGKSTTRLNVACRTGYKNDVEFVRIELWGVQAENACKYLNKGKMISFDGTPKTSHYEKDGTKRWVTDLTLANVEYLSPAGKNSTKDAPQQSEEQTQGTFTPVNVDDLPF